MVQEAAHDDTTFAFLVEEQERGEEERGGVEEAEGEGGEGGGTQGGEGAAQGREY